MKLSELINTIGDDNIGVQAIDTCVYELKTVKHGTRITFDTDVPFGIDGTEKQGLVLWLDREQVKSAFADAVNQLEPNQDGGRDHG